MLYAIVLAIVLAGLSGLPLVPVFVVGTFAMLGTAYVLSHSERLLSIGAAYCMLVVPHFLFADFGLPSWLAITASDFFLYGSSCMVMVLAGAIGLFAPLDPKILEEDGALQLIKEREAEQITSSLMVRLLGKK